MTTSINTGVYIHIGKHRAAGKRRSYDRRAGWGRSQEGKHRVEQCVTKHPTFTAIHLFIHVN